MDSYERRDAIAERFASGRGTGAAVLCGLLAAALGAGAVVSQHPAVSGAAVALVAVAAGIFILRHPAALLWTLVLTTPFADNDRLAVDVGGLKIRPYEVLAILGVLGITWHFLTRQHTAMREIAWRFKGTILIVLLLIASKIVSLASVGVLPPY